MTLRLSNALVWPIVVLLIAFGAFLLRPWEAKTQETISVTAEGKTDAVPDVAKISATISSNNPDLNKARAENEQKVSTIVDNLKNLNVEEKDIKTQYISGGPGYEVQTQTMIYPAPPRPSTNSFSVTLEVTIRDFETTDEIIQALTQNGATNLNGPQLDLSQSKRELAKSEARAKAVESARKKAEELAKLSGRSVGKAVKITEQGDHGYPVPMMASGERDLMEKASIIQPGQNSVNVNLAVEFHLK